MTRRARVWSLVTSAVDPAAAPRRRSSKAAIASRWIDPATKGAHRFREPGERDPTFGCLRRISDAALELEHPALHLGEAGAGEAPFPAIGAKAFCDEAGPTVSSFDLPDKDLTHLREVLSKACQEVANGVERLRIGGAAPKHLNETAQAVEIARGGR